MALQGAELAAAGIGQGQPQQDVQTQVVIAAWNLMGGLDWSALPVVAAMLEVDDVDALVRGLVQLREWQQQMSQG